MIIFMIGRVNEVCTISLKVTILTEIEVKAIVTFIPHIFNRLFQTSEAK